MTLGLSRFSGLALLEMSRLISVSAGLFVILTSGCGGQTDGRVPVSGTVVLDSQPLDRGSLELHPLDTTGTISGGTVRDGLFEIEADQGPKPGKYQVRIFAAGGAFEADPNAPPGPEAETPGATERVPARFNTQSELEVEIVPKGNRDLRFEIQSK